MLVLQVTQGGCLSIPTLCLEKPKPISWLQKPKQLLKVVEWHVPAFSGQPSQGLQGSSLMAENQGLTVLGFV
jgi:hypothetical protein